MLDVLQRRKRFQDIGGTQQKQLKGKIEQEQAMLLPYPANLGALARSEEGSGRRRSRWRILQIKSYQLQAQYPRSSIKILRHSQPQTR